MGVLFASKPGSVVALDETAAQCSTQFLGLNPDITFSAQKSIVTRVTLSHQVNLQFLHSLGALIYVYVFGDRMGQVQLSGLSFRCVCPDGSAHGADKMISWYKNNRASRRETPCLVMIGSQTIEGFVVNFTEDVVDPSTDLVQWGVTMATLPDDQAGSGDKSLPSSGAASPLTPGGPQGPTQPPSFNPFLNGTIPQGLLLPPGIA